MKFVVKQILKSWGLYFEFISLEIPNLIGIFSLTSILSAFLTKNRQLLILCTVSLFWFYLLHKGIRFLTDELSHINDMHLATDPKINVKWQMGCWMVFVILTMLLLYELVTITSGTINPPLYT